MNLCLSPGIDEELESLEFHVVRVIWYDEAKAHYVYIIGFFGCLSRELISIAPQALKEIGH